MMAIRLNIQEELQVISTIAQFFTTAKILLISLGIMLEELWVINMLEMLVTRIFLLIIVIVQVHYLDV